MSSNLTARQKAAILLMSLPSEISAPLCKELGPQEVQELTMEIHKMPEIDPAAGWRRRVGEKAASESNYDTVIRSAKVVLQDRTELDAAVVLRDPDHDFAYLRLSAPPKEPCVFIDLGQESAKPQMLDEIGALGRWDRMGKVSPWACTGRAMARAPSNRGSPPSNGS